jgi:tetratricopeptide (TPR) repeat protein
MCNHRGQLLLLRGRPDRAAELLGEGIRLAAQGRHRLVEAYAHKDLALARLALGQQAQAERALARAEELFQQAPFEEGLAHVRRVEGMVRSVQGRREEAVHCLRASVSFFRRHGQCAEAARSQQELARALRATGATPVLVVEELVAALELAEGSRREHLVSELERELRELSELEYLRRVVRHSRREQRSEVASLEGATVLHADLRLAVPAGGDPAAVLPMRNHLYADLRGPLELHGVKVVQFQGDGFVGLVRGSDHARAGVGAALAVTRELAELNRPRRVLGWPLWHAHLGLSSGLVCLGNSGARDLVDQTLTGTPVCVAAALQLEAEPGMPCISQSTQQALAGRFAFAPASPRTIYVKGLGPQRAWDVTSVPE